MSGAQFFQEHFTVISVRAFDGRDIVGELSRDGHGLAVALIFGISHAIGLQVLTNDAGGSLLNLNRVGQGAQGIAQSEQEGLPFFTFAQGKLGAFSFRNIADQTDHAISFVAIREMHLSGYGNPAFLPVAAANTDFFL